MLHDLILLLSHHKSTAIAATTSSLGSLTVAMAGVVPPDAQLPALFVTLLGPVVVLVANRLLSARAAKKRAIAEFRAKRSQLLLEDGDKSNDDEALKLAEEAAALRAEADALEALKSKSGE